MPFPTRFDDATDCSDGSVDCRRAFDVYVHVYVYDAITIARSVVSTCATIKHNVCAGEPPPPTPPSSSYQNRAPYLQSARLQVQW